MSAAIAASTPLLAALLWVAALLLDPGPLAPPSVLLVGVGLLALAATSVIGIIVVGARWAWRLGLVVVGLCAVLAVIRPIDTMWSLSLIATGIALMALLAPRVTRSLRRSPVATGPPLRAVLVPLILIGFPYVLGLAATDQPNTATVVVGVCAPLCAIWFARVFPLGLIAVRVLWPALAVGLAFAQALAPAVTSALGGALVAFLAWHPSVQVAFHPPRETGTSHAIPPELAPREVLDTAQLDDRGRPRG